MTMPYHQTLAQSLEGRRRALEMSRRLLAKRSGVSLPTVTRILTGLEKSPRVTSIMALAQALGVEVRFSHDVQVVEVQGVREMQKEQALRKARRVAQHVQGTMALEAQAVSPETIDDMVDENSIELLAGSRRRLWD